MTRPSARFRGTADYLVTPALAQVVEVALALGRPLLVKGEPGTGKTLLATAIAQSLGMELIAWNVKSTSAAAEGLYVYDTVQRLHDSRFGGTEVADIAAYIKLGPLGRALASPERVVLLIDEVDKADLEFPNDLLHELDRMSFTIAETGRTITARQRPMVVITSNAEKELPDAFLRRCVFHYLEFPDPDQMRAIVQAHHPGLEERLMERAVRRFYALRGLEGLRKRPSTSELLDWIAALLAGGLDPGGVDERPPLLGVLLKTERDLALALGKRGARPGGNGLQGA